MGSNISGPSNVGEKCNNALGYQITGGAHKMHELVNRDKVGKRKPKNGRQHLKIWGLDERLK